MVISNHDAQLLQHIIKHADEIADAVSYWGEDKKIYLDNHMYRNSCAMALQSMGENAKGLSEEFFSKENTLPWKGLKGLRNMFAHAYDSSRFNHEMIWDTIIKEVPLIRSTCANILHENNIELKTFRHLAKPKSAQKIDKSPHLRQR